MAVFEIVSKDKKKIRLTELQWAHISLRHPELKNQIDKIILTLREPEFIYYSPQEKNYHYYKFFKETPVTDKYLLLIIKYINGDGFVITAFFVSKIKVKGKVLKWKRKSQ
jgi:hypothetical protein